MSDQKETIEEYKRMSPADLREAYLARLEVDRVHLEKMILFSEAVTAERKGRMAVLLSEIEKIKKEEGSAQTNLK